MKKSFYLTATILAVVISVSLLTFSKPDASNEKINSTQTNVVNVSNSEKANVDISKALEARFLNMLNHSFVYNDTFDSVETMVNDSIPALLNYREDDSFIAEGYVSDYLFDMYGVEISDFSQINTEFQTKDGYVYIIPKGFTKYSHKIVSVTTNEDGTYTVKTMISSDAHDSGSIKSTCTSLFVPNEKSSFGFNIIYSDIDNSALAI